jgi:hypothetical protein
MTIGTNGMELLYTVSNLSNNILMVYNAKGSKYSELIVTHLRQLFQIFDDFQPSNP